MYLCDANGDPFNAETFDHDAYLVENVPDPRMLEYPEGRKALTVLDPVLFALVYCRHLISDDNGHISFADLHLELCRRALDWVVPSGPMESRHAFVAPRGGGKSSWTFKILPMWAACHGHRTFVAAFSDSSTQAQGHLVGFKQLLDTSPLLKEDYPDVCEPMRRPNGNSIADNQEMYYAKSGFTISAKGLDSGVLGMTNPANERPDCILLDDVEKDESNYTEYQARKRFITIRDTIFPMNNTANIFFVGTVTMPGSIVHELVKSVAYPQERPASWIKEENFQVHYLKPIEVRPDGTERSTWPENPKFELSYLQKIRHTAGFKKNLLNLPISEGEEYWNQEDFIYEPLPHTTRVLLQIDPAVTSKTKSDETAFAVIAFQPKYTEVEEDGTIVHVPARCEVREIKGYRLPPEKLREEALKMMIKHPEIGAIRIEANQGGDTWLAIFKNMPVKVVVHRESVPKKVRAMNLLNFYQSQRVFHRKHFRHLEEQMLSFPNVHHDDLIDAVGAGVHFFLAPRKKMSVSSANYTRR